MGGLVPAERLAVEESWKAAARELLDLWQKLRRRGVYPPWAETRQVLGLIVEIGFPDGTDAVAAYVDGSSQFFSRAGAALMGEDPRPEVEAAARRLISVAAKFVHRARPIRAPREPPGPHDPVHLPHPVRPAGVHLLEGGAVERPRRAVPPLRAGGGADPAQGGRPRLDGLTRVREDSGARAREWRNR